MGLAASEKIRSKPEMELEQQDTDPSYEGRRSSDSSGTFLPDLSRRGSSESGMDLVMPPSRDSVEVRDRGRVG